LLKGRGENGRRGAIAEGREGRGALPLRHDDPIGMSSEKRIACGGGGGKKRASQVLSLGDQKKGGSGCCRKRKRDGLPSTYRLKQIERGKESAVGTRKGRGLRRRARSSERKNDG